ncbi:MAG: glycosyltransferase family 4 protein [Verrucomicrobiaceae bacterium]|nr:glycosyltransferase family 4 protein [Verrucomicrobiaceae bacterium]
MRGKKESIHVWAPEIHEGSGGIQAFSRVYVKSLQEAYPDIGVHVFVKNDSVPGHDPLRLLGVTIHSAARYPGWLRTLALVVMGIGLGLWMRPRCAITTHLHFLPALRMLHWLAGIPVISVLHGVEAWYARDGLRVRAMRAANHLMAVSRHTRQMVINAFGVEPQRVSVVPNTFDTGRFTLGPKPGRLLKKFGLRPDQPVLLTVSRLALSEGHKGHRQVLVALDAIRRKFPDVRYLVVGTGDDLPRLRDAVVARGLEDCVIFAGYVPSAELPDYYRLCDAFVMPSSKEGFGIVFLEAMASGKPVVAGCLDGSVDALDGGRLGVLVDPNDPAKIADSVCRVLAHQPEGALWNDPAALRAAVVAQFGHQRVSRLMADDIAGIIGREPRSDSSLPAARGGEDVFPVAPRIVVITKLITPYHVEFFNALSAQGGLLLEVIYLTSRDPDHQWQMPSVAHDHLVLSDMPEMEANALRSISSADLAVFNCNLDWFVFKALRERSRARRPWVFWGEWPGFMRPGVSGAVARWFLRVPLHRQTAPIWAVGKLAIEGFRKEFGNSRTYCNIPYFCDLQRLLDAPLPPVDRRTFLYAGTLTQRRGVDVLASAFARLASLHPDARLVVMGTGPMEGTMRGLLKNCADKVTWLGFLPWQQTQMGYAQGSVFCFPARDEAWGLPVTEALASGLPVISTPRTGAAVEFVADGETGWLVPADDVAALVAAMEKALRLPDADFAQLQKKAREVAAGGTLAEGVKRIAGAATDFISRWRARSPGRRSVLHP